MNTCLSLRRTKMDERYRNILFRNEARNIRARSRVFFVCKKISPPPGLLSVWGRGMCVGRLFDPGLDQGIGVRLGPGLEDLEPLGDLAVVVELVALGQDFTLGLEFGGILAVGRPDFTEVSLLRLGDLVRDIPFVLAGLVGPAVDAQAGGRALGLGLDPGDTLVQLVDDLAQGLDGGDKLALLTAQAGGQQVAKLIRTHVTKNLTRLLRHCGLLVFTGASFIRNVSLIAEHCFIHYICLFVNGKLPISNIFAIIMA